MKMPKLPGGASMRQMMEQAQRMMEQAQRFEEEMDALQVHATAGGGVVKATVNGKGVLMGLEIAPEAIDPEDPEMLQDLIVSAVREAQTQAENIRAERMSQLAGGLGLDKLGLPF
ncbi:MAG: YbaB/EbfC family nucleoid-associated protein [Fimbriimonadales bacterium]|nr:YbaB/EbfC family nucleoid-associated protein [Fimbriimonadales bacterium]